MGGREEREQEGPRNESEAEECLLLRQTIYILATSGKTLILSRVHLNAMQFSLVDVGGKNQKSYSWIAP